MEGSFPQPMTSEMIRRSDRVILNVGGTKFETYTSTLTKYPLSLLGAMFHERNEHLLKPDDRGEYFFDRNPAAFEMILNWYRTGKLRKIFGMSGSALEEEIDYWQLPIDCKQEDGLRRGNQFAYIAIEEQRKKAEPILSKITEHIFDAIHGAAKQGTQSFSIEFKESQDHEFYAFLSNFSNRELLLHDLLQENLDVSFNDMTSGQGHSYILFLTLWNRYTRPKYKEATSEMLDKILKEMRQGVEIKTTQDYHVITVKPLFL
eukprot:TRINITY_DN5721_c0_g1_i1.p1 TRINITY_DN5721_c0_g1~~TRINITY_DN5721_c0_g1_i1.p1  ORF type:complete len:261 (-),score=69.25 TRINITY_DN5721_c0_g1_i1:51-833(-)